MKNDDAERLAFDAAKPIVATRPDLRKRLVWSVSIENGREVYCVDVVPDGFALGADGYLDSEEARAKTWIRIEMVNGEPVAVVVGVPQ